MGEETGMIMEIRNSWLGAEVASLFRGGVHVGVVMSSCSPLASLLMGINTIICDY